jgi:endonuclease YncB( thermonuclease family)
MRSFIAGFLLLVAATMHAQSVEYRGTVVVLDGDTFDLWLAPDGNNKVRIRLCGIDAAERGQRGGGPATEKLRNLVEGKTVRCVEVGDGTPCDKRSKSRNRDRVVAQCLLVAPGQPEKDIAEEMVRAKHACDWLKFSGGYYVRKVPGACTK